MAIAQFIFMATCYFLMSGLVCWRAARLLPRGWPRKCWVVAAVLMSVSFFAGAAFRDTFAGMLFRKVGVLWMVTLSYWVVGLVICEGIGWVNKKKRILPRCLTAKPRRAGRVGAAVCILVVTGLFVFGHISALQPKIRVEQVEIAKGAGSLTGLRVLVATDLHMGEVVTREVVARFVDKMNALEPDIILLPGDMIDSSVEFVRKSEEGSELKRLRAKHGVWGVTGNHERYAGIRDSVELLEENGVRMLRNQTTLVGDSFYVAGWDDGSWVEAKTFLRGINKDMPLILMCHQPKSGLMDQAQAEGVDLFLAGHTHGGQMWPATWIVPFMWEIVHGLHKRGDMQVYVSSGLGLWGVPVRLGTQSEIVLLEIKFTGE